MNEKVDEVVAILLPIRGRHKFLPRTLESLGQSLFADRMELVLVVDEDERAFSMVYDELISDSAPKNPFYSVAIYFINNRLFSVKAFSFALEKSKSRKFIWVSNSLLYEKDWFLKTVSSFNLFFPDGIGVLAIGGKKNKANFGMSSKDFVHYNEGEFFSEKYLMNFCDDELACRAILLGRYQFLKDSGIIFNKRVIEEDLLYDSYSEKISRKKTDRQIFYNRSANDFNLPEEKIYEWVGFRNVNLPLKVKIR